MEMGLNMMSDIHFSSAHLFISLPLTCMTGRHSLCVTCCFLSILPLIISPCLHLSSIQGRSFHSNLSKTGS
jgi:hypothetical protein